MTTPSSDAPRGLRGPAIILALGLAFGALVLSGPLHDYVKSRQTIAVKGYAERHLESDFAIWSATVTTRGKQINIAADQMDKATAAMTDFLVAQGVPRESIHVSDLTTTALTKPNEGPEAGELDGYKLDRRFEVTSNDIDGIARLSGGAPSSCATGSRSVSTPSNITAPSSPTSR
jgi:hypothetical protein